MKIKRSANAAALANRLYRQRKKASGKVYKRVKRVKGDDR